MLCPLIALLAFSLFSANVYADDPDPTKLAAVKKTLDEVETDARKNRTAYEEANEKTFREAEKALKAEADRLSKAGKPEEAVAVKKLIEGLKGRLASGGERNVPVPVGGGGRRVSPPKPLLERLAGKWTHPNHGTIYHLEANGLFHETYKADGKFFRQGQMQAIQDGTVQAVASDGVKLTFREAGADAIAVEVWDTEGKPWSLGMVLTRIK